MNHKISFKILIILIITIIFSIIMPTYVNAASVPGKNASASKISEYMNSTNDYSAVTPAKLKAWHTTLTTPGVNESGQYTSVIGKIIDEAKKRAETVKDKEEANDLLDIIGDVDVLDPKVLDNIRDASGNDNLQYSDAVLERMEGIDVLDDPEFYKPNEENSTKLSKISKTILTVINIVGVIVAVVALAIIGLRYMFGSIEEKAQYKETMVPYIIGLVMLGGISTIVNIIYNIAIKI